MIDRQRDYVLEMFSSARHDQRMDMPATVKPRKGRGAASNESGRFEREKRVAFDDGWEHAEHEPSRRGCDDPAHRRCDAHDHRPQRLAGYRLRPLDQPVSRLRARLHLLLCAAEPRLSRPVARPRFRDPHLLQAAGGGAARGGIAQEGLYLPADRARQQYRPVPAGRAAARDHPRDPRSAARFSPPGHDRHQRGADPARPRHPRRDGARQSGRRHGLGDDARPRAGAPDGAARRDPGAPARNDRRAGRRRDPDRRPGGADDPGAQRQRDGGHPRTRARGRGDASPAIRCCACRSN